MPKNEPRPFSVDNPESHDALVWIGEKGDTHPAPSGWIHEDVTPPRFEADSPEAEAHAQRAYHLTETKTPEVKESSEAFYEDAIQDLDQYGAMARDIMKTLPEEEWPNWVRNQLSQQTWGRPEPVLLPNPAPPGMTFPEEWSKQADSSLDASSDNWWGPQSVNLNQDVQIPGHADGMEGMSDNLDIPSAPQVDNRWLYLNGKVAIGGHWWDLAHRLGTEAGLRPEQITYLSNMVARNQLPPEFDVAMGELRSNGYPQIWQVSFGADRNLIYDEVLRELEKNQYEQHKRSFLPFS